VGNLILKTADLGDFSVYCPDGEVPAEPVLFLDGVGQVFDHGTGECYESLRFIQY
jgi:hypothetical protein